MAQSEPPKRWRDAALGGLLVAVGGALFGATRGAAKASPKPATKTGDKPGGATHASAKGRSRRTAGFPGPGRSDVRTAPNPPEATERTQYWPPPPPTPLDVYDDGVHPAEQAKGTKHLPVDGRSEKLGYERFDAKPGTIVKVMLSSAFVIVCCIAGLFYLVGTQRRDDRQGPPLTQQQLAVIVPPGPHLQDHPLHDIAMENEREFDRLKYYAWSGPDHRAGRIPIARAEALVTGRPLDPLPAPRPQPADGGTSAAPAAPAANP